LIHGIVGTYIQAASTNAEDHRDDRQRTTAKDDSHRDGADARVEDEIQVLKRKVDLHHQKERVFDDLQRATRDREFALPPPPVDEFPPLPKMGHILLPGTHPGDPIRLLQGFNTLATPPPTTPRMPATVTQPNTVNGPVEWYGMTTVSGNPQVIRGQVKAMDYLQHFNWSIERTFPSLKEAELWKVGKASTSSGQAPSGSDSDYKVDKWNKDKQKKRKRRKTPKKSGKPPDDSPPSSSSSSSSDSDSSESSDDSRRGSRRSSKTRKKTRKKARKKKKRSRKSRRKKSGRISHLFGVDPSTKDKKKLFGLSILGEEIDKAIAPQGFPKKEREVLFELAVDTGCVPTRYVHFETNA
jgi:hypothetical protein